MAINVLNVDPTVDLNISHQFRCHDVSVFNITRLNAQIRELCGESAVLQLDTSGTLTVTAPFTHWLRRRTEGALKLIKDLTGATTVEYVPNQQKIRAIA